MINDESQLARQFLSEVFGKRCVSGSPETLESVLRIEACRIQNNCRDVLLSPLLPATVGSRVWQEIHQLEATFIALANDTALKEKLAPYGRREREKLKAQLELLKRMKKLDFWKSYLIARFSEEPASQLVFLHPELRERLRLLRQGLSARDFLDNWPTITRSFQTLRKHYEKSYKQLHARRHKVVTEATRQLRLRMRGRKLARRKSKEFITRLGDLDCRRKRPVLETDHSE